jgi:small redox-active disulfide protein 2
MRKIQVLGPGCPKCEVLCEHVEAAARELGIEFEIEKVTDIDSILAMGVLATPALVVDGTLRLSGRVPSTEQLKRYLS